MVHHQPQAQPQVVLDKIIFKTKDIKTILRSFKQEKATGPYQVSSRVVKECSAEIAASPLCRFFQLYFSGVSS